MSDPVDLNADDPTRINKDVISLESEATNASKKNIDLIGEVPLVGKINSPQLDATIDTVVNPKTV